jgi:Flp pilus assembly protein TadG
MLVIFALVLIVMTAMTGLVIDGGDTFAKRRDMQNAADSAVMAAAYSCVNTHSTSSALAACLANATANGYPNATGGVTVSITFPTGSCSDSDPNGTTVTAGISGPHRNYFSGIVGMPTWTVSTTATAAATGRPNGAMGAMPIIFNQKAVGKFGWGAGAERDYDEPGSGNEDVPQTDLTFNWTVFCAANGNPCNANSNLVDDLINGQATSTIVVTLKEKIGPLNAGAHTTLFSDLADYVGFDYPVAIVDNDGAMVGWAYFHMTGSVGGSTKKVSGYFQGPVNPSELRIVQNGGSSNLDTGTRSVRLVN